ncbi:MAG: dihydropteroate synthase [Prevotella sp.]|nr:dihydropteroate synthase [Prevotella sp.]MDY4038655.1 dihydropteroate synthase [Prevotella sp.]
MIDYTLNIKGQLLRMQPPVVMGILNATPDSFYTGSRVQSEDEIARRADQIIAEGGAIIDVGACSTRPGGEPVSAAEEMSRMRNALRIIRARHPEAILSIDTFRTDVARMAVGEFGADIINDVSEGEDPGMFKFVAEAQVPYVLMSLQSNMHDMIISFVRKTQQLRELGLNDIILDPGFGFGKTMAENYQLLAGMDRLQVLELPILVGISRKRMIHQILHITPDEALNGTTVLNTIALLRGASILRVHDVRAAVEAVTITSQLSPSI